MLISRRRWLATAGVAGAAVALDFSRLGARLAAHQQLPPGATAAAPPPCDPNTKPTPARQAPGFRPGTPLGGVAMATGQPGISISLRGTVIGLRCGLIAGAFVDIWAGEARARQRTDANGRYRFEAVVPRAATGATRLNMRIDVPGRKTLTTVLFLPEEYAHDENARDPQFDPLLAMKLVNRSAAALETSFDVILDL